MTTSALNKKASTTSKTSKNSRFLTSLHAQPDGEYHWTKTQLKKLAEFEQDQLRNRQLDWSARLGEPDSWYMHKFTTEENAIVDFAQSFIQHGVFDKQKWTQLVQDFYQMGEDSFCFQKAFYDINKAFIKTAKTKKANLPLIDVLQMFYIHEYEARRLDKNQGWINASVMYRFINRRIQVGADKSALLADVHRLIKQDGSTEIAEYFTCLFPHDFDITPALIKKYGVYSAYITEIIHFLDDIELYAEIYAQYFWDISEIHVLIAIQKHHQQSIELINRICRKSYAYRSEYAKIVSKHLRILDRLYHVDVLQFLLDTADKIDMHKSLDGWLKRFPIYTLNHLFEQNITANYFEQEKYADLTRQMQNFFRNNPAIIKAYQNTLNEKPNNEKKKTYLETLDKLTINIDEKTINMAYAEATATSKPNKAEPSDKIKKIKFPTLMLNRICTPTIFNDEIESSYYQNKNKEIALFKNYGDYFENLYTDNQQSEELVIFKQNKKSFSNEQFCLLYLMVKPSFLISDNYKKAQKGDYKLEKNDFLHIVPPYRIQFSTENLTDSYYANLVWIHDIFSYTTRYLTPEVLHAFYSGELPMDSYRGRYRDSVVSALGSSLYDYLHICGDKASEVIVEKYMALLYEVKSYVFTISKKIDGYQVVPYFINTFPTKTKADYMKEYYAKHPKTVINETVYLLFTKQTEPLLKKAKTNAKVFWDWLLENDKDLLKDVLNDYDQQLTTPALANFLTDYEANQIALTQQTQQLEKQATAPIVNDSGIPDALLNDDWQKATRKRNFDIPDYMPQTDTLPQLIVAKTGEPLPKDAFERVLKMLMIHVSKPIPNLLNHLNSMTHESQQALAKALWNVFLKHSNSKNKWLIMASGLLYHAHLDDTVWSTIKENESNPWGRGVITYAIEALAEQAISRHQLGDTSSSSDRALRMLIKISQKARATIRPTAETQLQRYSEQAGISADDMADQLIPNLGLDAQGKRVFDFGERQFTMTLDANLKPIFTDNNGKAFKNLPKAGKNDDADKAKQAHAELKDLKKQLKEFIRDDVPRMENMLITQRRLSFANFKAYYVNNPLMLRYSFQLVWGMFDKDNTNKIIQPFRVVETGEILDINDDELTIADDALIGLVHPIQLTEEQRQQLSQSLQDDEIIQPFAQLARPVYQLTADEQKTGTITRFNDEKFATGSLIGFKNKGWEPYQIGGGFCEGYSKTVNGHELFFQFTGFGLWEGVPADDKGQTLEPIGLPQGMSDIDISEFIYVLDSMARLG